MTLNVGQLNSSAFSFIKGTKSSTKLEGEELDLLIVRYTYHHFDQREKMIDSMKKSIHQNGKIYILEGVKELDNDGDLCKDALSMEELKSSLLDSNVQICKEDILDEDILLVIRLKCP